MKWYEEREYEFQIYYILIKDSERVLLFFMDTSLFGWSKVYTLFFNKVLYAC